MGPEEGIPQGAGCELAGLPRTLISRPPSPALNRELLGRDALQNVEAGEEGSGDCKWKFPPVSPCDADGYLTSS